MIAARSVLRRLRYAGHAVECPVCERRFRHFADTAHLERVHCPGCGSRPRQRLLWLYLCEHGLLQAGTSILHLAPEPGLTGRLAGRADIHYVSADLEPGAAMVEADLTAMPFGDASFDLVLCSHVLEHIPDDHAAIREMQRVLREDGLAIVQTPVNYDQELTYEDPSVVDPHERLLRFSQADHVRVYGRDLRGRLESVGFVVTVEDPGARSDAERHGLLPRIAPLRNDLYCCRRVSA